MSCQYFKSKLGMKAGLTRGKGDLIRKYIEKIEDTIKLINKADDLDPKN